MDDHGPLDELEALAGIDVQRIDSSGALVRASDAVRCAVLRRLGHRVDVVEDAHRALERHRATTDAEALPPVIVAWGGRLRVTTNEIWSGRPWTCTSLDTSTEAVRGFADDDQVELDLDFGLYSFDVFGVDDVSTALVISAPERARGLDPTEYSWGVDVGDDVADPDEVARRVAEAGGAVLAVPSPLEADGPTPHHVRLAAAAKSAGRRLAIAVSTRSLTTAPPVAGAESIELGLPPDATFPTGQRWSPLSDTAAERRLAHHATTIARLDAWMALADIVRIEHLSGLDREWWHLGDPADGVWVDQPIEELVAIINLLSHRHDCAVIGEDLGGGRDRLRDTMWMASIAEVHVEHHDPDGSPTPGSVAVVDTSAERLGHSEASLVLVDQRSEALFPVLDRARAERRGSSSSWPPPGWWFGADEQHWFNEGSHSRLWHALGGRIDTVDGRAGTRFSVWAPNAHEVHVVGDFNGWTHPGEPMRRVGSSGVWDAWVPGVGTGTRYKYRVAGAHGSVVEKTDPMAFAMEVPPATASVVTELWFEWSDDRWMNTRGETNRWDKPISIYEVHLGSWRRVSDEGDRFLTYAEHVEALVDHVAEMGFTHVELLPITEHPLYASWGYQTTGYFAATSRYGDPNELMMLIDAFHQAGVGVILDWVPSHFPTDEFALNAFDGTQLYEHADPREGFHPDWKSSIFNYGRHEVRSFLLSSARFWLEAFHIDGLRVDAVASMLYRDYSRGDDWVPNRYGGRENLEAIAFLQQLNHEMYAAHPDILMIAEESTAWPGVTKPTDQGGLGFGYKWDMGWMNDTLEYFEKEPIHRQFHHNSLTFRAMYASSENYVLPLSHDEVVHGKGSLLNKMPGDEWQRFANLRLLLGWQYATPGKKLLFMGSELAPWTEWNHDESLPWHLTAFEPHEGVLQWVAQCNRIYVETPALHAGDTVPEGFGWIDANDAERSIYSFRRSDLSGDDVIVAVNATPVHRSGIMTGAPQAGRWEILASSDDLRFGGGGYEHPPWYETTPHHHNGYEQAVWLDLPGLSITFLRHRGE